MMDRRAFLRRLGFGTVAAAAAASHVLDIEKLLWMPGEKTIFIPPPVAPLGTSLTSGDVFTINGVFALNPATLAPTGYLQRFVITQDVDSGRVLTAARVCPQPRETGPYANVNASPVRMGGQIDGRGVRRVSGGRWFSMAELRGE